MLTRYLSTAILLSAASVCTADGTPAFPFTAEQFVQKFNNRITSNDDDKILRLVKTPGEAEAILGDKAFQRGVAKMKEMDLLNGKISQRIRIIMTVNKAGAVEIITISGYRGDPVNLFRTVGMVGQVYEILNPGWNEKDENDFLLSLGLMRGDADPTIGEPQTNFSKGGAFTCNTPTSSFSLAFGCVVVPRS